MIYDIYGNGLVHFCVLMSFNFNSPFNKTITLKPINQQSPKFRSNLLTLPSETNKHPIPISSYSPMTCSAVVFVVVVDVIVARTPPTYTTMSTKQTNLIVVRCRSIKYRFSPLRPNSCQLQSKYRSQKVIKLINLQLTLHVHAFSTATKPTNRQASRCVATQSDSKIENNLIKRKAGHARTAPFAHSAQPFLTLEKNRSTHVQLLLNVPINLIKPPLYARVLPK